MGNILGLVKIFGANLRQLQKKTTHRMLPDNSHILASSQEGNGWGVTSIEVDAEFYRSDQPDKHLQTRKKFLKLLQELQAKGWKRYYYPGGARMVDKIDIFQGGEDVYIDYESSEQEWLNIFTQGLESLSYELYADGVILSISLNADSNEYWQGYSIYKISMEFDALEYKFQDYSGVYKRDNNDRFIPAKWLPMVEEVLQSNDKYRSVNQVEEMRVVLPKSSNRHDGVVIGKNMGITHIETFAKFLSFQQPKPKHRFSAVFASNYS